MNMRFCLAFVLVACCAFAFALTGCSKKSTENSDKMDEDMKFLVLYYSQEGTTKAVAEQLQSELGADIEAIEVEEPYTGSYDETIQRVLEERENGIIPKVKPLTLNPKDYDVVFLGYPIWFGTYAPPIAGLIKELDFDGIKIVPFCSFGSGGLETSTADLKANLLGAEIADGYGVRTARIDAMPTELHRFLVLNGYIEGEVQQPAAFSEQKPVTQDENEIFVAATSGYKYPIGTAKTCGRRDIEDGIEYEFMAEGTKPDGSAAPATVYILVPSGEDATPVFTRVVR